jgi:hypothetical protein
MTLIIINYNIKLQYKIKITNARTDNPIAKGSSLLIIQKM